MEKKIKMYGTSAVIRLSKEDLEFHNLQIHDWVDLKIKRIKGGKDDSKL